MTDNINDILSLVNPSILIIEERKITDIVICAPHHATGGQTTLPCPEHTMSDENTGYIAREIAVGLYACSIIACNYTMDPNKSLSTDYSIQIAKWRPNYLIEIHGHGGIKVDENTIEISSGEKNSKHSQRFADSLNAEMKKEVQLNGFKVNGNYNGTGHIHFRAERTATINDPRWISFHIELPPALRVVDKEIPEASKAIIKALIATIITLSLSDIKIDLIPYRKKDKWGFSNLDRNIVIDCIYEEANAFSDGLACVKLNKKWGFINKTGDIIIPCIYEEDSEFHNGFAFIFSFGGGQTGYDQCWHNRYFINKDDRIIIDFSTGENSKYEDAKPFSEGLFCVQKNGKWGFVDQNRTQIIPYDYDDADGFSEGLANVKLNDKWGFIDIKENVIIPFKFENAYFFSEGIAIIKFQGKAGFINKDGIEVLPCIYEDANCFTEGLAGIKLNNKWGFINKLGKQIIPCIYNNVFLFKEGLAMVSLMGKIGFIDKNGTEIFPCIYNHAKGFSNGIAKINFNGKYGYINKNGIQFWED